MGYSVVGRDFATKVFSITTAGTTVTMPQTVKTFLLKASGGDIRMRKNSTDAVADAYLINDGEALNLDMRLPYPITDNFSTIGYFDMASGSATLYVIVGF